MVFGWGIVCVGFGFDGLVKCLFGERFGSLVGIFLWNFLSCLFFFYDFLIPRALETMMQFYHLPGIVSGIFSLEKLPVSP